MARDMMLGGGDMNFGEFLGNDALRQTLSAARQKGRLSHGYLLCGPAGAGKHTLALILAAAMECTGQGAAPCGQCPACRKVFSGSHPDVITCTDDKHKLFGVDAARWVCADVFTKPNEGKAKVYILPQEMNLSAQNTLLKVIEEPPAYAAFLILSPNADQLLPTVRSRLQELRLSPLSPELLLCELQKRFPDRSRADCLAAMGASGGYLGQAMEAMERTALQGRSAEFAEAYAARDSLRLTALLIPMEKLDREAFCRELSQWRTLLHEAIRAGAGLTASDAARAIARGRSKQELFSAMQTLQKACDYAQGNVGVAHLCGALRTML